MNDVQGWTVIDRGQKFGPFMPPQLIELAKAKRITASTQLIHPVHTSGNAVAADSIKQLKAIFDSQRPELIIAQPVEKHPEDMLIESVAAGGKAVADTSKKIVTSMIQGISSTVNAIGSSRGELAKPSSEIADFMAEGQDEKMIARLVDRVKGICMSNETPLYMAVQQRPIANFSPDAVVLTNRRFIVFQQKILGRLNFQDYPWREVKDVHLKEDMIGSTISFRAVNGTAIQVEWLPKDQARKVYRIAQEQEEAAHQHRRELLLEEKRAGVANTYVTTAVSAPTQATPPAEDDAVAKLTKLKKMLDAGLIEKEEYDATKARILQQM